MHEFMFLSNTRFPQNCLSKVNNITFISCFIHFYFHNLLSIGKFLKLLQFKKIFLPIKFISFVDKNDQDLPLINIELVIVLLR